MHLPEVYQEFGIIDNVSAFNFESYLGSEIKSSVRAGFKPLVQVGHHVSRLNNIVPNKCFQKETFNQTCHHENVPGACIRKLMLKKFILTSSSRESCNDSFVLLENYNIGEILSIYRVDASIKTVLRMYSKDNFFLKPLPSSHFGIYKIQKKNEKKELLGPEEILTKLLVLPYKEYFICLPLLTFSKSC